MRHCGHHPNVVPLLECNLSGEIPWLMYEYVEGGTLADALTEWRALIPPRRLGRAVRVLHAITGALGTFHRLDPPLVHRDLKPHNVLMAGSTPRITDFGIGGAAGEGGPTDNGSGLAVRVPTILQTAGSSRYAPQEQCLGSAPHPRDDVFALGIIAYQLIVGDTSAVPDTDTARALRAQRIPSELISLIVQSIALDPLRRPRDATEWEARLSALVKKKTVPGSAPPPPPPPAPPLEGRSDDDPTEPVDLASASEGATVGVTQTLTLAARGRWYSRPSARLDADWVLVTTTPADVRLAPGEVYRFSIHSAATEADMEALGALAGLRSLGYLSLSYCTGVTDAGLAQLKLFPGLRQLHLRGCPRITDAGLLHLRACTELQALELTECPQITPAAVAALRTALPKCKVLR
jgi:serine/threonine protein kinase